MTGSLTFHCLLTDSCVAFRQFSHFPGNDVVTLCVDGLRCTVRLLLYVLIVALNISVSCYLSTGSFISRERVYVTFLPLNYSSFYISKHYFFMYLRLFFNTFTITYIMHWYPKKMVKLSHAYMDTMNLRLILPPLNNDLYFSAPLVSYFATADMCFRLCNSVRVAYWPFPSLEGFLISGSRQMKGAAKCHF